MRNSEWKQTRQKEKKIFLKNIFIWLLFSCLILLALFSHFCSWFFKEVAEIFMFHFWLSGVYIDNYYCTPLATLMTLKSHIFVISEWNILIRWLGICWDITSFLTSSFNTQNTSPGYDSVKKYTKMHPILENSKTISNLLPVLLYLQIFLFISIHFISMHRKQGRKVCISRKMFLFSLFFSSFSFFY